MLIFWHPDRFEPFISQQILRKSQIINYNYISCLIIFQFFGHPTGLFKHDLTYITSNI